MSHRLDMKQQYAVFTLLFYILWVGGIYKMVSLIVRSIIIIAVTTTNGFIKSTCIFVIARVLIERHKWTVVTIDIDNFCVQFIECHRIHFMTR